MRCPDCQGTGFDFVKQCGNNDNTTYTVLHIKIYPCPSCNGSGIAYCCDAAGSMRLHEHPVRAGNDEGDNT